MNKLTRLFIATLALVCASAVAHAGATFTGNASQKYGNMTETFAQTYTLSGTTSAPSQIKVVSSYDGGSYKQYESFVFAKKSKATHNYLDSTGKVSSSMTGTYTLKKTSTKTTIAAKFTSGSDTYNDTFVFSGKTLKATFTFKYGSISNTTTFSGKQK